MSAGPPFKFSDTARILPLSSGSIAGIRSYDNGLPKSGVEIELLTRALNDGVGVEEKLPFTNQILTNVR